MVEVAVYLLLPGQHSSAQPPAASTLQSPAAMSSPGSQPQVLGLDSAGDQQGDTDREGELVALDYDIDTSKGEKALKVIAGQSIFSFSDVIVSHTVLCSDNTVGRLGCRQVQAG